MSTLFLISFISYGCVALLSILFALIYLTRNQFMPYHAEALSLSWSELAEEMQVLILALMRAAGVNSGYGVSYITPVDFPL
jgi:hypothetical protein